MQIYNLGHRRERRLSRKVIARLVWITASDMASICIIQCRRGTGISRRPVISMLATCQTTGDIGEEIMVWERKGGQSPTSLLDKRSLKLLEASLSKMVTKYEVKIAFVFCLFKA